MSSYICLHVRAVCHRCCYGHALDVHGGRHASIGPYTYSWTIHSPKDVLESIGGISCLLPMFPKLLIETGPENYRYLLAMPNAVSTARKNISTAFPGFDRMESSLSAAAGGGESGERYEEASSAVRGSLLLDPDLVEEMESEYLDAAASDNGCVGLLLSIIARCLSNNRYASFRHLPRFVHKRIRVYLHTHKLSITGTSYFFPVFIRGTSPRSVASSYWNLRLTASPLKSWLRRAMAAYSRYCSCALQSPTMPP